MTNFLKYHLLSSDLSNPKAQIHIYPLQSLSRAKMSRERQDPIVNFLLISVESWILATI
jgi:hypothetical protein